MNKRNELLQVATQLAAGFNASDDGTWDRTSIADTAVFQAKNLIEKVNAEFEDSPQVADSMRDAAPEMYKMLELAISYMDGDSIEDFTYNYQDITALLAKARGAV